MREAWELMLGQSAELSLFRSPAHFFAAAGDPRTFDCVVTDFIFDREPGDTDGAQFAADLKGRFPGVTVFLASNAHLEADLHVFDGRIEKLAPNINDLMLKRTRSLID